MYTTMLADPIRLQQFSLLCGIVRPFHGSGLFHNEDGRAWACAKLHDHLFAVPTARLVKGLVFGPVAERVLWLVHHEVRGKRVPQIQFDKALMCRRIWGASPSRRSLQTLRGTLRGLVELRVAEWPSGQDAPPLSQSLPLFERINEERDCFIIVVGEGLLGSLEQFAIQVDGEVLYKFPSGKQLKGLRKQQRVQDVYVPICLGDFTACRRFSSRQKRLFQAIVNEVTCPPKRTGDKKTKPTSRSLDNPQLITGDKVVGFNPASMVECLHLDPLVNYLGFNGNGVRRGCGYKLNTWMRKAGYANTECRRFLDDLSVLSRELGFIVAGIGKGYDNWYSLPQIIHLATGGDGQRKVDGLHIRLYAKADCFERWNQLFKWDSMLDAAKQEGGNATSIIEKLREVLHAQQLQQQQVAAKLKVSKQFLSAVLNGRKHSSQVLLERITEFVAGRTKPAEKHGESPLEPPKFKLVNVQVTKGSPTLRKAALDYYDHGLAVIPIRSWEVSRKPFVKWKQYQAERPTRQQVIDWWTQWPDAGIAAILGSVSNLLCLDVDGENACWILLDLLGKVPLAPTAKSGGTDPFRFHVYCRYPAMETGASRTPWNKPDDKGKLELRGTGGLLVLPPSLHKSGRRYAWVRGRSLADVDLPELPDVLLEGLEVAMKVPVDTTDLDEDETAPAVTSGQTQAFAGYQVAPSTARLLSGLHSESSSWNARLFRAGCDLHARGVPRAKAEQLLLAGSRPKTTEDDQAARDTIASAYSKPRKPSRY